MSDLKFMFMAMRVKSESGKQVRDAEVSFTLDIPFHPNMCLFDKNLEHILRFIGGAGSTTQWQNECLTWVRPWFPPSVCFSRLPEKTSYALCLNSPGPSQISLESSLNMEFTWLFNFHLSQILVLLELASPWPEASLETARPSLSSCIQVKTSPQGLCGTDEWHARVTLYVHEGCENPTQENELFTW